MSLTLLVEVNRLVISLLIALVFRSYRYSSREPTTMLFSWVYLLALLFSLEMEASLFGV